MRTPEPWSRCQERLLYLPDLLYTRYPLDVAQYHLLQCFICLALQTPAAHRFYLWPSTRQPLMLHVEVNERRNADIDRCSGARLVVLMMSRSVFRTSTNRATHH